MKPSYSQAPPVLRHLPLPVIFFTTVTLLVSSSPSSMGDGFSKAALSIAKHGCKDSCGDVRIPFPWGFGSGCFLDEWFEIECRDATFDLITSYDDPVSTKLPFLAKLGVEVLMFEISELYRQKYLLYLNKVDSIYLPPMVIIKMPPVNACTIDTHDKHSSSAIDLRESPYIFSANDNIFVLEGCSGSAVLVDGSNHTSNTTSSVGCATVCYNNNTVIDTNDCHGIKCCQTPLLHDLNSYQVRFNRQPIADHKLGQNCLLASLVTTHDPFYYVGNLSSSDTYNAVPVALTWSWRRNIQPDFYPYASCDFDKSVSLSWSCSCDEYRYGSNPYVFGGCPVPQTCQGCRGYCVKDEHTYPITYTCRSPVVKRVLDFLTILTRPAALHAYFFLSICIGPLLLVFGCRWLYRFSKRIRKAKRRVKCFRMILKRRQSSNNAYNVVDNTKLFTHKELDKATEHFNENRVLGKGGQGTVYKGMLTDGRIVAIKKPKEMDESQMEQFINEVVILSQTNHRNVVKLLGCCLETEVPLLAYEYISNGTLYQHIHNPCEDVSLSWAMRLKIAIDSAGAIAYLYSSSSTPIFHRDIKSANILLDDNYIAKVSDFGISKTLEIDQTHATTLVQGTFGYLDPEYFESSVFTEKSDVYSFGVMLLELLTSKKSIFRDEQMEQKGLASEFLIQMQNDNLCSILDPEVVKEAKEEEIAAYADLAKRCLNDSGRLRPTMREVAMALEMIIKPPNSN